jgi:hypothetical protein
MYKLIIMACVLVLSGCSTFFYDNIPRGNLTGNILLNWKGSDAFVYYPDSKEPLTFVRFNDEKIEPGKMVTDGGSIPRPLWIFRNYSPWGYAPAYIMSNY